MDCRQAAEILSASADGELLDAQQLALARQHCLECPECRQVERLIERAEALVGPTAPPHLLGRLDVAAAHAARHVREAAQDEELAADEEVPVVLDEKRRRNGWGWVTGFASVAAVLLVTLTMGGIVMLSQAPKASEETATTMSKDDGTALGSAPAGDAGRDFATQEAAQLVPSYVVFDDTAWVLSGTASAPDTPKSGTVTSDLGSGTSGEHDAFLSADGEELLVLADDGSYLAFTRVLRTKGRARYRMVTDVAVEFFGEWPTLPMGMGVPDDADGSPVFDRFGLDDLDVNVYTRRSGDISEGFAVAPGTAPDDPAAGNPNWTWWEKLP